MKKLPEFKVKKELGQNFLVNKNAIKVSIDSLAIDNSDEVIEIGPGIGYITEMLIKQPFKSLSLYELDESVKTFLDQIILRSEKTNISVFYENFLKSDLNSFNKYKIFGAIPYYITSPIIHKILEQDNRAEKVILIIQKEVADKLLDNKHTSYWTYITTGYKVNRILNLNPIDFEPAPRVKSTVILMEKDIDKEKVVKEIGFKIWSKFLHRCYRNPQKMINKNFTPQILENAGIESTSRAHNLTFEKLLNLYYVLKND